MELKKISAFIFTAGVTVTAMTLIYPAIILSYELKNRLPFSSTCIPTYSSVISENLFPFATALSGGIILLLCGLFPLIFTETVKQHCSIKTSALSFAAALSAGAGLCFALNAAFIIAFGTEENHPVQFPVSATAGLIAALIFIACIYFYTKERGKKPSGKGALIDLLLFALSLPFCFFAASYICESLTIIF